MSDILEELCALRRADAEAAAAETPLGELERAIAGMGPARGFAKALRGGRDPAKGGMRVISELKKASPSKGLIREDFRPAELAEELTGAGAAAISVLIEPHRFLGGEWALKAARPRTGLPLLYKDFVSTRYQVAAARALGADAVLLIAAALGDGEFGELLGAAGEYGLDVLAETHTRDEIRRVEQLGAEVVGVNCRDLRTFRTDPAITAELIAEVGEEKVRVAESGLRTGADLRLVREAGADAFLIGETLMRAERPGEELKKLVS